MSDFIFAFHSGFRYVVFVMGLAAAVVAAARLARGADSSSGDFALKLFRVFVVTVDIQVLFGIAVVILRPFQPAFIGHIVSMVLALAVAHVTTVRIRKRPADQKGSGPILVGVLLVFALIVGGIMAIGRPLF